MSCLAISLYKSSFEAVLGVGERLFDEVFLGGVQTVCGHRDAHTKTMPVASVDGHGESLDSVENLLAVVSEPRRSRLGKLAEQLLGRFHGVLGGPLKRQN